MSAAHGNSTLSHCTDGDIDTGDTTWVLISTILVMGMLPALAFFEAGLLRSKNTLSLITQIIGGFITLTVMWDLFGYSLTFSTDRYFILFFFFFYSFLLIVCFVFNLCINFLLM